MKTKTFLSTERADALDLIFQDRNKGYGAYQLRREYPTALRKALTAGVALVILGIAVPYVSKAFSGKNVSVATIDRVVVFEDVAIEKTAPPPPMPKVVTPPPVARPQQKFVPPKVTRDDEPMVEEKIATTDELAVADPSTATLAGDPNSNFSAPVEPTDLGETEVEVVKKEPENKVFIRVEQMPQFPGGEREMLLYLRDNIRYPAIASENGIEGLVVVQFVVNEDGNISDLKVMKGVPGGCSEEAVRVIKKMPLWSPDKQNGRAVKVQFTVPVRFSLN